MVLCVPWDDYKNKQFLTNMKIIIKPSYVRHKIYRELTKWAFFLLGLTLTYTTTNLKN